MQNLFYILHIIIIIIQPFLFFLVCFVLKYFYVSLSFVKKKNLKKTRQKNNKKK
jgi:ABC-type microcin C transport system permease subunit YejE